MALPPPLLKLTNVTRQYSSPGGAEPLTVLAEVSIELQSGQSLAIVGPSGSGKSTLLHIIGALDRPSGGSVLLDGEDLVNLNEAELSAVRNQQIGFVFQTHFLLPQCTVIENVLVPTLADVQSLKSKVQSPKPEELSAPIESVERRAIRLLGRVGLGERMDHRPGQLSGGERQRVAVVRALINRPHLLLADEPTGSLDHASAIQLIQLLLELNREENVALIVVTHALDLARRMERVLELKDGRLA